MITIVCFSKKNQYRSNISNIQKRLKNNFIIDVKYLDYKNIDTDYKKVIDIINKKKYFVILLDERGKELNNVKLANTIINNKDILFIIGGPFGIHKEIHNKANLIISLGQLIYPYDMCELILVEQIYRSQCIINNHPYHHG